MRVFELDGKFIDLESITMIGAIETEMDFVHSFPVYCKLHQKPFYFGDQLDDPDPPRKREQIEALQQILISEWRKI